MRVGGVAPQLQDCGFWAMPISALILIPCDLYDGGVCDVGG